MIVYMCTLTPSPSLYRQIFQLPTDYYLKTIRFFGCIFIRNIRKIGTQSIESINKPSRDAMIDESCPFLVQIINIMRTKTPPEGLVKANSGTPLPQKTIPENKKTTFLGNEELRQQRYGREDNMTNKT